MTPPRLSELWTLRVIWPICRKIRKVARSTHFGDTAFIRRWQQAAQRILRCPNVRSPEIGGRVQSANGRERGVVVTALKSTQMVPAQDIYVVHLD
jgi:hypothetical protein